MTDDARWMRTSLHEAPVPDGASPPSPIPVVMEGDFLNVTGQQVWRLNNTALKCIRDTHESPYGQPICAKVPLFNSDPYQILTLERGTHEDYRLRQPEQPWSWRLMIKNMEPETRRRIVGPGITDFFLAHLPGSYDHKRRAAGLKFD